MRTHDHPPAAAFWPLTRSVTQRLIAAETPQVLELGWRAFISAVLFLISHHAILALETTETPLYLTNKWQDWESWAASWVT